MSEAGEEYRGCSSRSRSQERENDTTTRRTTSAAVRRCVVRHVRERTAISPGPPNPFLFPFSLFRVRAYIRDVTHTHIEGNVIICANIHTREATLVLIARFARSLSLFNISTNRKSRESKEKKTGEKKQRKRRKTYRIARLCVCVCVWSKIPRKKARAYKKKRAKTSRAAAAPELSSYVLSRARQ